MRKQPSWRWPNTPESPKARDSPTLCIRLGFGGHSLVPTLHSVARALGLSHARGRTCRHQYNGRPSAASPLARHPLGHLTCKQWPRRLLLSAIEFVASPLNIGVAPSALALIDHSTLAASLNRRPSPIDLNPTPGKMATPTAPAKSRRARSTYLPICLAAALH